MDKLRAIKFFCRIAEAKSFAAAAHDLDVVPSVLSKTIASLEHDIDFRLFNRTTRKVSLTENGALYYERCKRLVVELEEAELLSRKGKNRPVGRLAAGVHPSINRLLMYRVDEFLARYPDVTLETTTTSLASTLIEDRLDVLFMIGDLPDSSFGMQRLATSRFVLVATPAYLQAYGTPEVPADLDSHIIIASARRDSPSFVHWAFSRGAQNETVYAPARMILREGVHMHEACLSGAGICRLVEFIAQPFIASGDFIQVLPEWLQNSFPINAVFPSRKDVPAKARVLVSHIRAVLKEKEWWMRRGRNIVAPGSRAAINRPG